MVQEMVGLSNGIGSIAKMVGAPEQTRARRRVLPAAVVGVTIETWIRGFVNHADDAFTLHPLEVHTH